MSLKPLKELLLFQLYTFEGVLRNVPTYKKYITIDGLQTRCACTVGYRAIGLDVIHRYIHRIDYRNAAHPRRWTARPDLVNDDSSSTDDSGSTDDSNSTDASGSTDNFLPTRTLSDLEHPMRESKLNF